MRGLLNVRRYPVFVALAFLASIGLEALGYAQSQAVGDTAVMIAMVLAIVSAGLVGRLFRPRTSWIALLGAAALAGAFMAANAYFVQAFRLGVLAQRDDGMWQLRQMVYGVLGMFAVVVGAAWAFLAALLRKDAVKPA